MSNVKNLKRIAELASQDAPFSENKNINKNTNTKTDKLVRNVPDVLKEQHKELLDNGYTELSFSKFMIEATAKQLKSLNRKYNK
ncbi:hypothetical protein [Moritella viscosa]|uniref:hypothetical protein n=1 Tax=Moritella viscosa TaxID=80854 RepID=UPI000923FE0E|nr:hypothetical protein [Moritella viscosa]SGZ17391.1 unnamed protein product [Moritella viscosa]SHO06523.1 unnamed protein product [Moritella viscosa]